MKSSKNTTRKVFFKKNIQYFLLVIILIISIFFRFYNIPARYSLGDDSTRDALVAIEGAKEIQFPLTGPFSSLGPFTFGPWYYYQLILFTLITHLPYAPWIYLGIASVLFVFVMYKIGESLLDQNFGLIVATITAVSPAQISTATGLSNPNLISIYAGLSILLFIKLIKKEHSLWWSTLFGFVLGIGINLHYQMSGLLILPILLLIYKRKKYMYFITSLLGVGIAFIPLLFFDLNNHWYTVRNMFYFYTEGRKAFYVPNRWLFYLRDFWPDFWSYAVGTPLVVTIFTFITLFAAFIWTYIKKKYNYIHILFLIAFIFNFILLRYYWGVRGAGYLQYLHPFLFVFTGYVFWVLLENKKYYTILSSVLFIILIISILPRSIHELQQEDFNREIYRQEGILLHTYPNQQLALYNCKTSYKVRTQALTTLFAMSGKLSVDGTKVGLGDIRDLACEYPKDISINEISMKPEELQIVYNTRYPKDKNLGSFNITNASEEARLAAGWVPYTPKIVFDSTVRWWFNEKP